ncbi:flagellar protein FlgN [Chromobacterium haemolyticum]|uniref:Flagellar protein FlgN n=1 Tax=Chromobacterium fluminis TaxID=3044269 RepID=A0ABX0L5V9_9NEIS|nr:flagellar protein FlgN [Chromobacterium haemolyticum]NHR06170.1 flagellar protein FlgN [Chromobacterium haemolyticum]
MNVVEEFCQLCRAESALVARLIALLEQEQKVLVQGFDVQLDALAESKSAVLDQLAVSAAQRGELMRQIGVQDSETVYIWLADKPEASLAWTGLEEAIQRAQSINQLNGSFIDQRLSLVEGALNTLRDAAASTVGYDKAGQLPELATGRRFLGSA